jgi:hypothetical protein
VSIIILVVGWIPRAQIADVTNPIGISIRLVYVRTLSAVVTRIADRIAIIITIEKRRAGITEISLPISIFIELKWIWLTRANVFGIGDPIPIGVNRNRLLLSTTSRKSKQQKQRDVTKVVHEQHRKLVRLTRKARTTT